MPLPKDYLPRDGDIIVVHAKVKFDVDPGEDRAHIRVVGSHQDISVPLDKIVQIHCRKWSEGDEVVWNDRHGTVLAVHEDNCWLSVPGHCPSLVTAPANDLEPLAIAPETEQRAEPPTAPGSAPHGDDDAAV